MIEYQLRAANGSSVLTNQVPLSLFNVIHVKVTLQIVGVSVLTVKVAPQTKQLAMILI
jgi:hypothetical protein